MATSDEVTLTIDMLPDPVIVVAAPGRNMRFIRAANAAAETAYGSGLAGGLLDKLGKQLAARIVVAIERGADATGLIAARATDAADMWVVVIRDQVAQQLKAG